MKLVQIKLSSSVPFWFLGEIQLSSSNPISDFYDISVFNDEHRNIINSDVNIGKITLIDYYKNKINSLDDVSCENGEFNISLDDITEEDIDKNSFNLIELDENKEDEELKDIISLLKNNINTIKHYITTITERDNYFNYVKKIIEIEETNKNRKMLINFLNEQIYNMMI